MLNSGWSKFDKYYRLTEESPAYTAALVLNPKRKWRYIENHWKKSWHKAAKDMVKRIWETEYRPMSSTPVTISHTTTNDFWLDLDAEDMAEAARVDEYAQYCTSPIVNIDDAIGWWMQETQRNAYPNLSKMALIICRSPACQLNPNGSFQVPKQPLQTDETVLEVICWKLYSVYGRGCISGIKRLTYWQDWMARKATGRGNLGGKKR
jgi:hypothetical protein